MTRLAVIGGTGMSQLVSEANFGDTGYYVSNRESLSASTQYGDVPLEVLDISHPDFDTDEDYCGELKIFVIHRHHGTGITPPHLVNYHANVRAAADCQPDAIVSIQSVGSIDGNFAPGIVGMAEHTLDLCGDAITFSEDSAHHADMTHHYPESFRGVLRPILARQSENELSLDHIVAHMVGPQFETPAEVEALRRLGATAVNMTIGPEAKLVAELEIPHIGLIASSNWAAGQTPGDPDAELDHHSVESRAGEMRGTIWHCLTALLEHC